jgi:hypothetical protein
MRIQAPTVKKRTSLRAKAAARSKPALRHDLPFSQPISTSTMTSSSDSSFASSKKDKQRIKHSSFVSKIEKASTKTKKRRRPNKQLVANLESLADALPGLEDDFTTADGSGNGEVVLGQAKIHRKSLKSRPGAMKRKEKIERMERERFNANLAQMAAATSAEGGRENAIADRWAALKNHVRNTVEQKPEFAAKK